MVVEIVLYVSGTSHWGEGRRCRKAGDLTFAVWLLVDHRTSVVQFSSVSAQDDIVALGKAHTRSAPSLSSLPMVVLETVSIFV